MRLTFLGTRGGILARSALHRRHSALLVESGGRAVMIDRGRDWLTLPRGLKPDAVVLTHAHDDHAGGLSSGATVPVYATAETAALIARFPLASLLPIVPGLSFRIGRIAFIALPVEHSLRAPAVALRVAADRRTFLYAPDVADLPSPETALRGVGLYVGDGASLNRPLVKQRDGHRIGHASIRTQLGWCAQGGVRHAVFTHCGTGIVRGDAEAVAATLQRLADEAGVAAAIAYDGMAIDA